MSLVSDQEWAEYKQKFNKSYADAAEDQMRRELFAKSKATVEAHNKKYDAGEASWKMCLNHLSDVTPDEMASRCGNKTKAPKSTSFTVTAYSACGTVEEDIKYMNRWSK